MSKERKPLPAPVDTALQAAGRSLPHSTEAEQGVLACILIGGSDSLSKCVERQLLAEAFFQPANQSLYEVLLDLYKRNQPLDDIVVFDALRATGKLDQIGGPAYLADLQNRIRSSLHLERYIEIVREKYLLRRLIRTCTETVEGCFQQTSGVEEFIANVETEIMKIGEGRPDATQPIRPVTIEAQRVIEGWMKGDPQAAGLPSGFEDLDSKTYGFHKGDMVVLAARPSMGKTSLAMNFVEAAAIPRKAGMPPAHVLVFSLEMTAQSLVLRMICARAGVEQQQLRSRTYPKGGGTLEQIVRASTDFLRAPIKINDSSGLSISEIRAISRRIHQREPLGMIVIDYLQLIKGSNRSDNREQEVAEISRGVKALAKELQVPVIVLSQLNRASEKDNRQPRISDLRESGSIEQDADVILLLAHKEGKTDIEKRDPVLEVELIIAKQRNGEVGTVPLVFKKSITRFSDPKYTA